MAVYRTDHMDDTSNSLHCIFQLLGIPEVCDNQGFKAPFPVFQIKKGIEPRLRSTNCAPDFEAFLKQLVDSMRRYKAIGTCNKYQGVHRK